MAENNPIQEIFNEEEQKQIKSWFGNDPELALMFVPSDILVKVDHCECEGLCICK